MIKYVVNDETEKLDLLYLCECHPFGTLESGMTMRLFNALIRNGVNSIEDLADVREEQVKKWYGIGVKKLSLIMKWKEYAREYITELEELHY